MNEITESTVSELDIQFILLILKRNWRWIVLVTILCAVVGFSFASWVITPQYAASTMLVVNSTANQNTNNTITNDQLTTAQELVNTYSVILKSDTVTDQVISDLGLKTDADALAKKITVEGVDQTQVLKITVKNPNPQLARNIANDIARVAPKVIVATVEAGSVKVVSNAKLDLKPVFPSVPLFAVAGAVIGLIASYLIFLIRELLDNTFDNGDDVEKRLGISVIGVIPVVSVRE